jgi:hypothetical protein
MKRVYARRLNLVCLLFAFVGSVLLGRVARVAAADRPGGGKHDEAVGRGLSFLAKQQKPDGSFDDPEDQQQHRVVTSALAVLAFLSAGHTPDVGRYGIAVRGAVDYVVAQVPDDGYVGKVDGSRMYGQGIVTLALAEAYGIEPDAGRRGKQHAALKKLVKVILTAQDVKKEEVYRGGWRYEPQSTDSDISLSGWNALALRAAQDVGVPVPKESIRRAADFVARCYHKDAKGFAYIPGQNVTPATNGTGLLALHLLDRADRPETKEAAAQLARNPFDRDGAYPYYTLYYATQGAFQAGDETWTAVAKVTLERLTKTQDRDGGWPGGDTPKEPGRVYRTCMGVLTLTVEYRLLPIYQR